MSASPEPGSSALRTPPRLATGDRAVIVAPCSPFDRARFERGVRALQTIGLEPAFGAGLFDRHPEPYAYLAGDDARRLSELRAALEDPAARLLVLARGGYGLLRISEAAGAVPPLSPAEIARAGKLVLGYSDATVLHELWSRAGLPSLHGPMCTQLGEEDSATVRLRALLFGGDPGPITWTPLRHFTSRLPTLPWMSSENPSNESVATTVSSAATVSVRLRRRPAHVSRRM